MAIKRSLEERVSRLEAFMAKINTQSEKNSSNIDFLAMMEDIDIWSDEEDLNDQQNV